MITQFSLSIAASFLACAAMAVESPGGRYPAAGALIQSPGATTYIVDPINGDDANRAGKPWKSFSRINAMKLAPGDKVVISPGLQTETFKPSGEGTAGKPIVVRFLPGVHVIKDSQTLKLPIYGSAKIGSSDATFPLRRISNTKHRKLRSTKTYESPTILLKTYPVPSFTPRQSKDSKCPAINPTLEK